jgi:hypothetical protein
MKITEVHHVKMLKNCESELKTNLNVAGHLSVEEKYVFSHLKHSVFPKDVAMRGNVSYFDPIKFYIFLINNHKTVSFIHSYGVNMKMLMNFKNTLQDNQLTVCCNSSRVMQYVGPTFLLQLHLSICAYKSVNYSINHFTIRHFVTWTHNSYRSGSELFI